MIAGADNLAQVVNRRDAGDGPCAVCEQASQVAHAGGGISDKRVQHRVDGRAATADGLVIAIAGKCS